MWRTTKHHYTVPSIHPWNLNLNLSLIHSAASSIWLLGKEVAAWWRWMMLREGPDFWIFWDRWGCWLQCDIKLFSLFTPSFTLLYFETEILRFDIVNLRNPSNFKFNMKRVIPSGLHVCDQILDGENGRWWSPKSIGKIKHIFLPLLLLYRKIHFFEKWK